MANLQHRPRAAIRGSVSTPIPRGWITLGRLLAETGIDRDALNNLRQRYRYVIPRPIVIPLATGRGGAAFYPPKTITIIRRLQELRREKTRNPEDCLWRLWLEGHRVDIRGWIIERLEAIADLLAEGRSKMTGNMLRNVAAALIPVLDGRVRRVARLADLADWCLSAGAGEEGADHDLKDASGPPIFDTLRKAGGLPLSTAFPAPEAELIELLDLRRMAEIAAEASDEEVAQAWRDYETINRLSAAIADVDWSAVRLVAEPNVAKVTGAKPDPPSWQARKAKRTRALPPPAIIGFLSAQWRSYDYRAVVLAFLIGVRRLPGYSRHITELLALAAGAISLFPRSPRNSVAMP